MQGFKCGLNKLYLARKKPIIRKI